MWRLEIILSRWVSWVVMVSISLSKSDCIFSNYNICVGSTFTETNDVSYGTYFTTTVAELYVVSYKFELKSPPFSESEFPDLSAVLCYFSGVCWAWELWTREVCKLCTVFVLFVNLAKLSELISISAEPKPMLKLNSGGDLAGYLIFKVGCLLTIPYP